MYESKFKVILHSSGILRKLPHISLSACIQYRFIKLDKIKGSSFYSNVRFRNQRKRKYRQPR